MTLRVLHVLDHSWPILDGYSQRSRSIVKAQSQIGLSPLVLTGPSQQVDDPGATDLSLDGIRYFRTGGQGISGRAIRNRWPILRELMMVRTMRLRIEQLFDADRFDLSHAHSPALCGLAAARAARSRGFPFVYEIRSFWEDSAVAQEKARHGSLRYRLGRGLETHIVRHADAVVGISQAILSDLAKRNVASSKLFHVPNGVDTERFIPRQRDPSLAAEFGLNNVPTLGYLGTLFPWEGIPWLVRAAAKLRCDGTLFKLLIVGDGAVFAEVQSAIQEVGAQEYVLLLGRVAHDQVEHYYSLMDVLVYPRLNFRVAEMVTPLKPLEAMALGKAVLGSDVGGIRELIEPEVDGLLFDCEDVEDFCRQATRLLQDAKLRRQLGDQARHNVTQEKDWKVLAGRYANIYNHAMQRVRSRPGR